MLVVPIRFLVLAVFIASVLSSIGRVAAQNSEAPSLNSPPLRVSQNNRYLVYADGRPFLYLGDTAWELFHRLNRSEADQYLENRATKGINVIQAVVLGELNGIGKPNANGDLPFIDQDVERPNEAYFEHVDDIVDKAESLGIYIGMLPTWGRWVGQYGDYFINEENARGYGRFLGKRYRDKPIIWILGGDRPADINAAIWNEMARGLKEGDEGRHLMTFHPPGGTQSSTWFHYSDWLDFNMVQSGHDPRGNNYYLIQSVYFLQPPKPCLDGEPAYEYPPDDMPPHRAVGALEVRRRAYWSLFCGTFGYTYGTHPIWQMYDPPRKPLWDVHTPWHQALDLPGVNQLLHVKSLMLSRPILSRIPDQSVIYSGLESQLNYVAVTRDGTPREKDASYLMAYFPQFAPITLRTEILTGDTIRGWWFNPRDGSVQEIGEFDKKSRQYFEPPTNSTAEDWILVLDDASQNYPPPGSDFPQVLDGKWGASSD